MTELLHWQEWHRECALARCDLETRNALTAFVSHRFCSWLREPENFLRQNLQFDPALRPPGAEVTWQEFELDAAKDQIAKRSAKDYLLERAQQGGIGYLQAAATLRVRETVRRWIRFEVLRKGEISSEMPLGHGEDPSRTIGDLIEAGCEIDEAEAREFDEAAGWVITQIGNQITEGHRVALALMEADIPFSWPEAETFSGRSNTTLASYRDDFGKMVKRWIEECPEFDGDTTEAKRTLTGMVIARVARDAYKQREGQLKKLAADASRRLIGKSKQSSGNCD